MSSGCRIVLHFGSHFLGLLSSSLRSPPQHSTVPPLLSMQAKLFLYSPSGTYLPHKHCLSSKALSWAFLGPALFLSRSNQPPLSGPGPLALSSLDLVSG